MNPKNRPLLALLVLVLASLACTATYPAVMTIGQVECKDKHAGKWFNHYFTDDDFYSCSCPSSPLPNRPPLRYTLKDLQSANVEEMEKLYCAVPTANTVTELPTATPTEEPAPPTEAATDSAPLNPFLTGNFTTCDNAARYVNFSIAEGAPPYDPATFKLLFNGYEANCAPAANSSILTCNYPPVAFDPPAVIQVFIGDELVNEFDFNGGEICKPVTQPNNDNNGEEAPAPTEPAPTEDTGGDG